MNFRPGMRSGGRNESFEMKIARFICPIKSELPKLNPDSSKSSDIQFVDALTMAESKFYDTIRIKIGLDKG